MTDSDLYPGMGEAAPEERPHQAGESEPPANGSDPHAADHGADAGDVVDTRLEEPEEPPHHRSFWRELPFLILVALVIAVVIKTFVVQAFWIPSSSMENTLQINDRVLVNKLSYDLGDISRGDVIVFDDPRGTQERESVVGSVLRNLAESVGVSTPKSEFIKRVIGLPGETIEILEGVIYIDGESLSEAYLHPRSNMPDFGPETVQPGTFFVMGDNRNSSQDSRFFGPIDEESIVGKAFVVLWPPSRWSGL